MTADNKHERPARVRGTAADRSALCVLIGSELLRRVRHVCIDRHMTIRAFVERALEREIGEEEKS